MIGKLQLQNNSVEGNLVLGKARHFGIRPKLTTSITQLKGHYKTWLK